MYVCGWFSCVCEEQKWAKNNLMRWKEALKKRNMNINMEKTKIMVLGWEESVEIEEEDIKIE